MKIENYKHLFVPVEQALPEYEVLALNKYSHMIFGYISKGEHAYHAENDNEMLVNVIGWLDLSRLTTKERAEDLAKEAYYSGWVRGYKQEESTTAKDCQDFINLNINKL